jgi:hypothetical protein
MTTASASQRSGSPEFLLSPADAVSALETSGVAEDVRRELGRFTPATRDQAVREIGRITAELTDVNPVQIIVDVLVSFHELRAAGQRTLDDPGGAELVELIQHQITFEHQPTINVVVNGQQVAALPMVLSLVFVIQALTATVTAGRLTALQLGRCDVTGTIAIAGRPVTSRTGPVTLPASIPLGVGVPLIAAAHDQRPRP